MYEGVTRWLSMRLDSITAVFSLSVGLFVVFFTHYAPSGSSVISLSALGVALVQSMSLGAMLQFSVRQVGG